MPHNGAFYTIEGKRFMLRRGLRLLLASFAMLPLTVGAAEFGEPVLYSQRGQPLHLVVPVHAQAGEGVASACYRIDSREHSLADVRLRLLREGEGYQLQIAGTRALTFDGLVFELVGECGLKLRRKYRLTLPDHETPVQGSGPVLPHSPSRSSSSSLLPAPLRPTASPIAARKPRPAAQDTVRPMLSGRGKSAPADCSPENLANLQHRIGKMEELVLLLTHTGQQLDRTASLVDETLALKKQFDRLPERSASSSGPTPGVALAPVVTSGPTPAPATVPATVPVTLAEDDHLWDLLLMAGVGAALAAMGAFWWRRRREQLASLGYGPESAMGVLPLPAAASPPPGPESLFSLPPARAHGESKAIEALAELPAQDTPDTDIDASNAGDSMLELAEIMLSFGRLDGAAETVAEYIESYSPQNIAPWLLLLDLYRRGNMRAEFDHFSNTVKTRFNVQLPTWESSTTVISGWRTLEDYPHILGRISELWGEQECVDYLQSLTQDNRGGQRAGFPLEIVEEIVLLLRVLENAYQLKRIV